MPEPSNKSPKAYQFMFVLYPDSQQEVIDYVKANWPCAWALHDKDTHTEAEYLEYAKKHEGNCPEWQVGDLKPPHYHFLVKFKNARYASGVAKELRKIPSTKVLNDAAIRKCFNLYYCHPQAPHERGGNENNNKLLRRHFPKGTSMKNKTQYDATMAQHFINGYPREMFGGRCSSDLFKEELQKLNLKNPQKIYKFFNI